MTGWFDIGVDREVGLVRLTMGGFFDAAAVDAMRAAVARAIGSVKQTNRRHLTLCDITKMDIQSQDMVQRFATLLADPRLRSDRLAFVTGATLARLQARRLTDREGVAFFMSKDEALSWLTERRQQAA